ncbi:MAG: ABC transporter permease [Defluviitaleaceae bacterium]|nr:ABC transporter permease [Defluviitaleaceae bacterium]
MNNSTEKSAVKQGIFGGRDFTKTMDIIRRLALLLVLFALMIFFSTQNENFLTLRNAMTVLRSVSITGVIALGMTLVIIAGEIDLSVGSMVALSGVLTAWLVRHFMQAIGMGDAISVILAITITLGVGILVGLFTATLRNYLRIPSFITTLGLLTALSGVAYLISGGFPIITFPSWYRYIGAGWLFEGERGATFPGIPFQVIILFVVFILLFILLHYTRIGRSIYAVGANEESARLSGVSVKLVRCVAFGITGFLAALSGIMVSSQIMTGAPAVGAGGEMNAISAVIIGGASLSGGVGKITGTLIGILFLGVLGNGMTMMGMDTHWQAVIRGALVIAAVLFNMLIQKRS